MFQWLPYPFIRILIFFISGIVAGIYFPADFEQQYIILWLPLGLFIVFIFTSRITFLKNYFIAGFSACMLIAITGFIHVKNHLPSSPPEGIEYFEATVMDYPEEKENSIKYEIQLRKGSPDGKSWRLLDDKVLLYVSKEKPLEYGDVIIAKAGIQKISGPRNPEEFDYSRYLFYKGIYGQAYCSEENILKIGEGKGNSIVSLAFSIRAWVDQSIDNHFEPEAGSILKALLVGIRSEMDDDLKRSYAAAGAVHVLAVSGLHVGIFYGLILWSLGWLRRRKGGKLTFAAIALFFLWLYAFVTGFSPSILRAVLMFSFIIIAQATNRGSGIYNAVAGSAFLLLSINPLLLVNVGFQLSYLAVLGIVYLYPRLITLWEFNNLYADRVWQMSVVGIAAQIATFPLALFYFHQFPTYFLLSNLVVIPAATAILCSGMAFLAVSWLPTIAGIVATVTGWIIYVMNSSVKLISDLPFSTINEIFLSPVQLVMLITCILLFIAIFAGKSIKAATAFLMISGVFIISKATEEFSRNQEKLVQFYSIDKITTIDFIDGRSLYTYNSLGEGNDYYIQAARKKRHAVTAPFPHELIADISGNEMLFWNGKKILILNGKPESSHIFDGIDYLLIENGAVKDIELLYDFEGSHIIVGTRNSARYRDQLLEFSSANNIEVIDLNKGSLAIQL